MGFTRFDSLAGVCVRERKRERDRQTDRHGKRDELGERERDAKQEMLPCLDFTEHPL